MWVFPRLDVSSGMFWKVKYFARNKFGFENYILWPPIYIPGYVKKWMCIRSTYSELVILIFKIAIQGFRPKMGNISSLHRWYSLMILGEGKYMSAFGVKIRLKTEIWFN